MSKNDKNLSLPNIADHKSYKEIKKKKKNKTSLPLPTTTTHSNDINEDDFKEYFDDLTSLLRQLQKTFSTDVTTAENITFDDAAQAVQSDDKKSKCECEPITSLTPKHKIKRNIETAQLYDDDDDDHNNNNRKNKRLRCDDSNNSDNKDNNNNNDSDDDANNCRIQQMKNCFNIRTDIAQKAINVLHTIRELTKLANNHQNGYFAHHNVPNRLYSKRSKILKSLYDEANMIPLFINKTDKEQPPPLCGAIPCEKEYIAKMGDLVGANVTLDAMDGEENWILAEVIRYHHVGKMYEVDDIDDDEKQRYAVTRKNILFLPNTRADPRLHPQAFYQPGTRVMALYPQSTVFYPAVVQSVPSTHTDPYIVCFEDQNYEEGFSAPLAVFQRYVTTKKQLLF